MALSLRLKGPLAVNESDQYSQLPSQSYDIATVADFIVRVVECKEEKCVQGGGFYNKTVSSRPALTSVNMN
jgi:hypothetical protein